MLPHYLKKHSEKGLAFSVETDSLIIRRIYDGKQWVIEYREVSTSADTKADAGAKV